MFLIAKYEINPHTKSFQSAIFGALSGDEPHYLISINSILYDHDLDVRNNYKNIRHGGLDAGRQFKGQRLDHHTYIVNRETGVNVLWQKVFHWNIIEEWCTQSTEDKDCYKKRGRVDIDFDQVIEIGAHPIAFPAIIASSIAPVVQTKKQVEPFTVVFLILCSWFVCILVYFISKHIGLSTKYSLGAAAILVLASPWTIYSRSLFTENMSGLFVILTFYAITRKHTFLAGITMAVAVAIKPALVVLGWGWIICFLLNKEYKNAIKLTATVGLFGVSIITFNYWLANTVFIAGAQGWIPINSLEGLYNGFTDINYGLFVFVPWTVFVLWIVISKTKLGLTTDNKFYRNFTIPIILYYLITTIHGDSPGFCYGPRYWIPLLPLFSILITKHLAESKNKTIKSLIVISVTAGAVISIPAAIFYRYVWSMPFYTAPAYFWEFIVSII